LILNKYSINIDLLLLLMCTHMFQVLHRRPAQAMREAEGREKPCFLRMVRNDLSEKVSRGHEGADCAESGGMFQDEGVLGSNVLNLERAWHARGTER
jgi:hypothetical protein